MYAHISCCFDRYDCEHIKLTDDGNVNVTLDDDYLNYSGEGEVGIYDIRLEEEQDLLYKSLILIKKL